MDRSNQYNAAAADYQVHRYVLGVPCGDAARVRRQHATPGCVDELLPASTTPTGIGFMHRPLKVQPTTYL